jgi:hypothetical protein
VYVDVDSGGTDDYGDPATTTGSSGALALNDIPAGTWTVRIAKPPHGDTATSATLTVASGQAYLNTDLTVSTS